MYKMTPRRRAQQQYERIAVEQTDTVYHFKNAAARAKALAGRGAEDIRFLRNSENLTLLVNKGIVSNELVKPVDIRRTVYVDRSKYPGAKVRAITKVRGVSYWRKPLPEGVHVYAGKR